MPRKGTDYPRATLLDALTAEQEPARIRIVRATARSSSGNPNEDLIIMGTTKSSETLSQAEYLRSMRTTTQAEADAQAAKRGVRVRYQPHDRHVPAAH